MTWRVLMLGTAVAALTLTFGSASSAEDGSDIDYNRLGGYIELGGVYAWSSFGRSDLNIDGDSTGGFSLRLGNRFDQFVAVEFQYEFLAQLTVTAKDSGATTSVGATTEFYTHQMTFNFRVYPFASEEDGFFQPILAGRIQPFALAGLGVTIIDTPEGDAVGFVSRFGLGVDLYATKNIVLSLEGTYALSSGSADAETAGGQLPVGGLDHVSLGVGATYRF